MPELFPISRASHGITLALLVGVVVFAALLAAATEPLANLLEPKEVSPKGERVTQRLAAVAIDLTDRTDPLLIGGTTREGDMLDANLREAWQLSWDRRYFHVEAVLSDARQLLPRRDDDVRVELWRLTWPGSIDRAPAHSERIFPPAIPYNNDEDRENMIVQYGIAGIFDPGPGRPQERRWLREDFPSSALAAMWLEDPDRVRAKAAMQEFTEGVQDRWEAERLAGRREGAPMVAAHLYRFEWDRFEHNIDDPSGFDFEAVSPTRAIRLFPPRAR